jgi:2-hydroxychromene-2-carboxylate isomerase
MKFSSVADSFCEGSVEEVVVAVIEEAGLDLRRLRALTQVAKAKAKATNR